MKTLKSFLLATIVAIALVNSANADGFTKKPNVHSVINVTIEKAIQVPGMMAAMYSQLDRDRYLHATQKVLYANVILKGRIYHIRGTREQWINFFKMDWDLPAKTKNTGPGVN